MDYENRRMRRKLRENRYREGRVVLMVMRMMDSERDMKR